MVYFGSCFRSHVAVTGVVHACYNAVLHLELGDGGFGEIAVEAGYQTFQDKCPRPGISRNSARR